MKSLYEKSVMRKIKEQKYTIIFFKITIISYLGRSVSEGRLLGAKRVETNHKEMIFTEKE
ncbi:hypothetical protein NUITMVRE36_08850 [Enterococcus raffinosus]|nr:hypothetical protein NUITMVRE36_08850 [Enterococcus raffinosus]